MKVDYLLRPDFLFRPARQGTDKIQPDRDNDEGRNDLDHFLITLIEAT